MMTDFQTHRTMMVDTQVRPSDVTKFPIIDAMLSVPREEFVPDALRECGLCRCGDRSWAQVAACWSRARWPRCWTRWQFQPDEMVLDLGCGLGYSAAVIARMADFVVAVEEDEAMANEAEDPPWRSGVDNVAVIAGPLADGAAQHGPYDVIMVQGAVEADAGGAWSTSSRTAAGSARFLPMGASAQCAIGYKRDGTSTGGSSFNAAAPVLPGFERRGSLRFEASATPSGTRWQAKRHEGRLRCG